MLEKDDLNCESETVKTNLWRKPISDITWGFVLTSFTINFFLLNFILPTIGFSLIYIGFRKLRKVNKYFTAAWILSIIRMLFQALLLIFAATPLVPDIQNSIPTGVFAAVFQITLFLTFRGALKTVFKKCNTKMPRDPLIWAVVWTILICICANTSLSHSWLALIFLFIMYCLIFRSLYLVGNDLYGTECSLATAPKRINDGTSMLLYSLGCIILVIACSIISNHIVPDFTKMVVPTENKTRIMLSDLGFPEEILRDISDENISILQDAINVEVSSELLLLDGIVRLNKIPLNNEVVEENKNGAIEATTVYTELANNTMYALVYFRYIDSTAFWNDGFAIKGQYGVGFLDGKLLYTKNGDDYISSIPRLKCDSSTQNDVFKSQSCEMSGGVCYPFGSENQRGYVFYCLQVSEYQQLGGSIFNYLHSASPLNFPYTYPDKKLLSGIPIYPQHCTNFLQHCTNFYFKSFIDTHPELG